MEKENKMYLDVKEQLGDISSYHVCLRNQTEAASVMTSWTILQTHQEKF